MEVETATQLGCSAASLEGRGVPLVLACSVRVPLVVGHQSVEPPCPISTWSVVGQVGLGFWAAGACSAALYVCLLLLSVVVVVLVVRGSVYDVLVSCLFFVYWFGGVVVVKCVWWRLCVQSG